MLGDALDCGTGGKQMINEKLQKKVEYIIAGMEDHSFIEILDELLDVKDDDGKRIFSVEIRTFYNTGTRNRYIAKVRRLYPCNCAIETEYRGTDLPFALWRAVTANINLMAAQKNHLKEKK